MPRKRTPFVRIGAHRDARLIIIATEDTKATVAYFQTLVSPAYYQSAKVHVEILTRDDTASSPARILRQLDEWRNEYQLAEEDELWLVIDVDQWGARKLSQIAQECLQKTIRLAISNPAIELWFLLHLIDLNQADEATQQRLLANRKNRGRRSQLEQAIVDIVGSYNKAKLNSDHFLSHINLAIERAERLDRQPTDRWPQQLGTRVYLLVQSIIKSSNYR